MRKLLFTRISGSAMALAASLVASFLFGASSIAQTRLASAPMPDERDTFSDFQLSPDNRYLVYRANKDAPTNVELYAVRLSTGVVTKLSGAVTPAAGEVRDFKISADSRMVVFAGDLRVQGLIELYSVYRWRQSRRSFGRLSGYGR
jgi:hypothetical protein